MKLLSVALRSVLTFVTGLFIMTGASPAWSQTSVSNFSVTITQPTNGSSFIGPTNLLITAQTTDSFDDVAYVSFTLQATWVPGYNGAIPLFVLGLGNVSNRVTVGAHTEAFSLSCSNAGPAQFGWLIAAFAFRSNGVQVGTGTIIKVNFPTSPTVNLAQPTNNEIYFGPTNLSLIAAAVETNGAIASVQFSDGYTSLGFTTNFVIVDPPGSPGLPPGSHAYLLTWSNAPVGSHVLTATALDTNNQVVSSTPVHITIQRNPSPLVDIAYPTNQAAFVASANIQLAADAYEPGGSISNVEFFDGATSLGVSTSFAMIDPPGGPGLTPGTRLYFLSWSNASVGGHTLRAVAMDINGITTTSAPVGVFVIPDTVVRMTSPANNSFFRAPVNVALTAYAQSVVGSISSVEFFANATSLGFGRPVPPPSPVPGSAHRPTNTFQLLWSNTPPGTYALTAIATMNSVPSAPSAPVNITVVSSVPPPTNRPDLVSIVATDPVAIASTNCWSWLALASGPPTWSNWVSPTALWRWNTNCGPEDALFTVHRIGPTNDDLAVSYSISGTASNGVDYSTLSGTVTILAGQAAATITLVPIDGQTNYLRTVILSLQPSANLPADYAIGFPPRAEALIIDRPLLRPGLTGALLGDRSFHLTSGGPDGAWFRVDYSSNAMDWTPICTNQVVNGSIDFADPDAGNSSQKLYRTVPVTTMPGN